MLRKSTTEEGREKEDLGGVFYDTNTTCELAHHRFLVDAKTITIETRMADGVCLSGFPVFPCGWAESSEEGISLVAFLTFADGSEIARFSIL